MASPAQRPQQLLRCKEGVPIGNGFCEECRDPALEHFGKANQILEGALRRGPLRQCSRCDTTEGNGVEIYDCDNCGALVCTVHSDNAPEQRVLCDACVPETRECENCGQHKPVEEMETVFLPGTGESYQCEQCRGVTP